MNFNLQTNLKPTGDQPRAIKKLVSGLKSGKKDQVLLGVTGSGKTLSVSEVINRIQRPTLVISHNKTLTAQLFQEFREFFPENAVHYFVSYYDYYQPEAYIPSTDTYIEKDASINEAIDRLRHGATQAVLSRRDTIIVASVSCIYGIGSPEEYQNIALHLKKGRKIKPKKLMKHLVDLQYRRNQTVLERGTFRRKGNALEIASVFTDEIVRLKFTPKGKIQKITRLTHPFPKHKTFEKDFKPAGNHYHGGESKRNISDIKIWPAKHYVTPKEKLNLALENIKTELQQRIKELKKQGKHLEAQRLNQKTRHDLEMLSETGYCKGIENYSRHLSFREPGQPPKTLVDYFWHNFGNDWLLIIDESHMSIPQIRGMYEGDRSRKEILVKHGFRLPSAYDNRPLKFSEFEKRMPSTCIYMSATPGPYELKKASKGKVRNLVHFEKMARSKTMGLKTNENKNTATAKAQKATETQKQKTATAEHAEKSRNPENKISQYYVDVPGIIEQLIRPTGLLDPEIAVLPTKKQIENLIGEIKKRVNKHQRVLVTTITQKLAENIVHFLEEKNINALWLHAKVPTLERPEILKKLRKGKIDVVVGINLLREGLDLPEVSLVAILDADKEGFLRNETTLIQTMGRAARHPEGKVVMYADEMTGSMKNAIFETKRRRRIQEMYNKVHNITPQPVKKPIREDVIPGYKARKDKKQEKYAQQFDFQKAALKDLKKAMRKAAQNLQFEKAAYLRDKIEQIQGE